MCISEKSHAKAQRKNVIWIISHINYFTPFAPLRVFSEYTHYLLFALTLKLGAIAKISTWPKFMPIKYLILDFIINFAIELHESLEKFYYLCKLINQYPFTND